MRGVVSASQVEAVKTILSPDMLALPAGIQQASLLACTKIVAGIANLSVVDGVVQGAMGVPEASLIDVNSEVDVNVDEFDPMKQQQT